VTGSALVSGGKDSVYAAALADAQGIRVDELVTIRPSDPESFLFHTPNLDLVALQAAAWGKEHRVVDLPGTGEAAEADGLRAALATGEGWVSAGAIASAYQWSRLNRLTWSLGRPLYTPLWGKDPYRVVRAEIAAGLDIRFVHLAAEGLDPAWLGERLDEARLDQLQSLAATRRPVHVAGEGGEFETLVVDAPFFQQRIEVRSAEVIDHHGAHRWQVRSAVLVPKGGLATAPRKRL
jgi:diphthine-ammonia ligase